MSLLDIEVKLGSRHSAGILSGWLTAACRRSMGLSFSATRRNGSRSALATRERGRHRPAIGRADKAAMIQWWAMASAG